MDEMRDVRTEEAQDERLAQMAKRIVETAEEYAVALNRGSTIAQTAFRLMRDASAEVLPATFGLRVPLSDEAVVAYFAALDAVREILRVPMEGKMTTVIEEALGLALVMGVANRMSDTVVGGVDGNGSSGA